VVNATFFLSQYLFKQNSFYRMKNSKLNTAGLLKATPLAIAAAVVVNVALFYLGSALGLIDPAIGIPTPDGRTEPITVIPVIMASTVPVIIAAGTLALLNQFTANPLRIFGIITLVLVLLSFSNPFMMIPNVSVGMGLLLNLMHIVVAGSVWYFFSRYTRKG